MPTYKSIFYFSRMFTEKKLPRLETKISTQPMESVQYQTAYHRVSKALGILHNVPSTQIFQTIFIACNE